MSSLTLGFARIFATILGLTFRYRRNSLCVNTIRLYKSGLIIGPTSLVCRYALVGRVIIPKKAGKYRLIKQKG